MNKQDITMYSEEALSLHVFNDEYLYNNRHMNYFIDYIIKEMYIYTEDQLEVLENDLKEDLEEE